MSISHRIYLRQRERRAPTAQPLDRVQLSSVLKPVGRPCAISTSFESSSVHAVWSVTASIGSGRSGSRCRTSLRSDRTPGGTGPTPTSTVWADRRGSKGGVRGSAGTSGGVRRAPVVVADPKVAAAPQDRGISRSKGEFGDSVRWCGGGHTSGSDPPRYPPHGRVVACRGRLAHWTGPLVRPRVSSPSLESPDVNRVWTLRRPRPGPHAFVRAGGVAPRYSA